MSASGRSVEGSSGGAPTFPLSAIVGQEQLVQALLINAVAGDVGGVLIRGERGTAKTTAVRALASLLAPIAAAADQAFAFAPGELAPDGRVPLDAPVRLRAAPLVELPLGTTLDRLLGSLDLARALNGERAFEPGLLARAHGGILYVDEVNLLADHLVDALLDAAATGVARVEREAVSVTHDARFVLVGTMNVEEGELRPQLLDRFGLGVEVKTPADPAVRAEIVRRRLAFERDPRAFCERFAAAEQTLAQRIEAARRRLEGVVLPERELLRITGACARLGVDGVRGDIVCARAACALAALEARDQVAEQDVRRAAALALAHRRRADPLDGRPSDEQELARALDGPDDGDEPPPAPGGPRSGTARQPDAAREPAFAQRAAAAQQPAGESALAGAEPPSDTEPPPDTEPSPTSGARERLDAPASARLPTRALSLAGRGQGPHGRRARSSGPAAGAIDSRPARQDCDDLAVVATLRARLLGAGEDHWRQHVRAGRESAFLCLVVDASGSMGARRRAARVKGALLALLRDAYARRDRVAVVAFRDSCARVLVAPGTPLERAAAALRALPTGGRTPLAAGLRAAERLITRERSREATRRSIAIVLTDGRVDGDDRAVLEAARSLARAADAVQVIDSEDGPVRVGICASLARAAGAAHHRLSQAPPARRAA
jgi:magnesium chelatase subunit D